MSHREIQFANPNQLARFGLFYVVLASLTWAVLHLIQLAQVPNLAFGAMLVAGLSFLVLPKLDRTTLGVQIGIWFSWGSVLLLGLNQFFGSAVAVGGFIIVTLMVMVFARGQTWIWVTLFSLCAIVALHLQALSSINVTETLALMVAQLAQFLGAAILFALIFAKFRAMLADAVSANKQLSRQRVQLQKHSAELHATQASLEQINRILQHVNDNLPARITYFNVDGAVLYSNRFPEFVGTQTLTLLGCINHLQLIGASASALVYHTKQAFAGEAGTFEVRRLKAPKDEVTELVQYVPQTENGTLTGVFSLATNITDSRRLEEMFQQAQKLESLGMLAGGVAHDFNNLLVSVLGQNSLAREHLKTAHPARKHVDRAVKAAERASILTKQMLAYSGRGAFSAVLLDINALIQQNLELLKVTLPRNVKLDVAFADALPSIEADEAQIQQVIMNLIINAGQAIGEQVGTIAVSTQVETVSAESDAYWRITGKPLDPGEYVSIRIKDNGEGIGPDQVTRIFDPFYTTKAAGTGLGLAAVIGVIRGHRGGIKLTTQVGQGTEFQLLFPVASPIETMTIPLTKPSTPATVRKNTDSGKTLILVIDDEEDVLEVVSDMLDLEGIASLTASNGADGISLFQAHHDEICLVLLDLMMPGLSGAETFPALREIDPAIPIVLSSGYSEAEASRHFVGGNLAEFIQKPYDFEQLINKVTSVMATEAAPLANNISIT